MKKIPVGATIAHAYRFAFGQFVNLLALTWLPLATVMIISALTGLQTAALSRAFASHDFSGLTVPWPLLILVYAVVMVMNAMWATAIFQYALGRAEARDRRFYFSFAAPLWRIIGAVLAMLLSLAGVVIAYVIAILIVLFLFRLGLGLAHISHDALRLIMAFDAALAFAVGYCGLFFCAMRFGFLLMVATIAENRIALFRSWSLSHGNFWRMFVVSLTIFLPLLVVEGVALYGLGIFPHWPAGATPDQFRVLQQAASTAAFAKMQRYWYLFYPGSALINLIVLGLMAGAQSFAWRALTEDEAVPHPSTGSG